MPKLNLDLSLARKQTYRHVRAMKTQENADKFKQLAYQNIKATLAVDDFWSANCWLMMLQEEKFNADYSLLNGHTPLSYAMTKLFVTNEGDRSFIIAFIAHLLDLGANPQQQHPIERVTMLQYLVIHNFDEPCQQHDHVALKLISKYSKPDNLMLDVIKRENRVWSAIDWATHFNWAPVVRWLLVQGMHRSVETIKQGRHRDRLVSDCYQQLGVEQKEDKKEFIEFQKMEAQIRGNELLNAVRSNDMARLALALQRGNILFRDGNGNTALHHAAESGASADIIKILIDQGLAIDVENFAGETPLLKAIVNQHQTAIAYLLSKNANKRKLVGNETVLMRAFKQKVKLPIIDILISDYDSDALCIAATAGNLEAVTHLLKTKKKPIDSTDSQGNLAVRCAVIAGHVQVANYLLANDAEFDEIELLSHPISEEMRAILGNHFRQTTPEAKLATLIYLALFGAIVTKTKQKSLNFLLILLETHVF